MAKLLTKLCKIFIPSLELFPKEANQMAQKSKRGGKKKLSAANNKEIFAMRAKNKTLAEIAAKFGVTHTAVAYHLAK